MPARLLLLLALCSLLAFPACARRETPVQAGLRTGTILVAFSDSGAKVAVVPAKDKLRGLLDA